MCNVEEAIWLETHLFPGRYNQLSWTTRSTGAKSQGRCTEGNSLPPSLTASVQPPPPSISPQKKKKEARTTFFCCRNPRHCSFLCSLWISLARSLEDSWGHWDTETSVDQHTHVVCCQGESLREKKKKPFLDYCRKSPLGVRYTAAFLVV